jgi:protein phosphatase
LNIAVPGAGIVILIGASSSGKSTFARKHFKPTEIVSSDACRAMVADTESAMWASQDAFNILHAIAAARLRNKRLTVIDATNVRRAARKRLIDLAHAAKLSVVAVVFDIAEPMLLARSRERNDDRSIPDETINAQAADLRHSLAALQDEGFEGVFVLTEPEAVDAAVIVRASTRSPVRSNVHVDPEQTVLLDG